MSKVEKKYTGLNAESEVLADLVPSINGVSFQTLWNEKFAVVRTPDNYSYRELPFGSFQEISLKSELTPELEKLVPKDVYAVVKVIDKAPPAHCQCRGYSSCTLCISKQYESHDQFIDKHIDNSANKSTYLFKTKLSKEKIAEERNFKNKAKEKKRLTAELNYLNNGFKTPWGVYFNEEFRIDSEEFQRIKREMKADDKLKNQHDSVTGSMKDLEVCVDAVENGDYRYNDNWVRLGISGNVEQTLSLIRKARKKIDTIRLVYFELDEIQKVIGSDSEVYKLLTDSNTILRDAGFYLTDSPLKTLEETSTKVYEGHVKTLNETLASARKIIESKLTKTTGYSVSELSFYKMLKELYATGWKEEWGDVPDPKKYYSYFKY